MPDKVESEDGATKNESADALCENISPVDKANANKPGTDYETEVGDDCELFYFINCKVEKDIFITRQLRNMKTTFRLTLR